jgi:hypothetical protein
MATTTNYSWSTPDDTALVKDGASAIRSLGTAIDSTVFTNAGAAVAKATVDAKGDLIAGTADNTVSRLAVGANDTVLTADSTAATGMKWAAPGGAGANWTLLNSGGTALTGAATITVSGISGKDKIMIMVDSASSASASSLIQIRLNADTDYVYQWYGVKISAGSSYSSSYLVSEEAASNMIRFGTMSSNADSIVSGTMTLTGCNASGVKVFNSAATGSKGSGNDQIAFILGGYYNKTATISSISVVSGTGNFDAGTVYVYTSA